MVPRRILVTGGMGFVGSWLALMLKERIPSSEVIAFDNLKRRGSDLNVPRLSAAGISFIHGDIRCTEDLESVGSFDLLIDCSAEPSVKAGLHGSPRPILSTNLIGTLNCLEAARRNDAAFLFISTSRVYPINLLNAVPFEETETRFAFADQTELPGVSCHGIAEDFPLGEFRSLYGATKLAAEFVMKEYAAFHDMPVLINRCGIITGPWQMARVDQGVVALWTVRHAIKKPLRYIGFGGTGKQVRDILDVRDFGELVLRQIANDSKWDGRIYNVGGGVDHAVSLAELTDLCQDVTGHTIDILPHLDTSPEDLRIYMTDHRNVSEDFEWHPEKSIRETVSAIHNWFRDNRDQLIHLW
jgi:CDP-paratose 2-epimerase